MRVCVSQVINRNHARLYLIVKHLQKQGYLMYDVVMNSVEELFEDESSWYFIVCLCLSICTQNINMREKLLQDWAKLSCLEEDCQTMLEVKNVTRPITLAYQYKNEMKTPLLTVGIIQDFHKEVLKSDQRAGKLRDCHVCTNFNFEIHIYPPPYLIETQ